MKTKIAIYLVALFLFIQCTTQKPIQETSTPPTPPIVTNNLSGQDLYTANCAACHDLYSPNSYTENEWNDILVDMIPNTKLSTTEATRVKEFLFKESKKNTNYHSK